MTDTEFAEIAEAARGWARSAFEYVEASDFPGCGWGAVVIAPADDEESIELDAIDEHVARPIVTMLNGCPGLVAEVKRLRSELSDERDCHNGDRAETDRVRALLGEAATTIRGLADQQAMADDHYQPVLDRIDAALRGYS